MHASTRKRRRRWPWIVLGSVALVLVLATGGIVFGGTQVLLTPHHGMVTALGKVIAVDDNEITLSRTDAATRVGTYGLVWDGADGEQTGSAVIGPVLTSTAKTVTRPISNVIGRLSAGTEVQLNPNIHTRDPKVSLGIDFSNVAVDGELGAMPAWQVPGTGSTWVLFVHGIDGQRESGLRPLPTIVDAELPTLLITYRNDVGAPASPSGLIALGQTEWRDLEAAAAIVAEAVFLRIGIIGVAGTEGVLDRGVVLGFLVGILDQQADRRAASALLEVAGDDADDQRGFDAFAQHDEKGDEHRLRKKRLLSPRSRHGSTLALPLLCAPRRSGQAYPIK